MYLFLELRPDVQTEETASLEKTEQRRRHREMYLKTILFHLPHFYQSQLSLKLILWTLINTSHQFFSSLVSSGHDKRSDIKNVLACWKPLRSIKQCLSTDLPVSTEGRGYSNQVVTDTADWWGSTFIFGGGHDRLRSRSASSPWNARQHTLKKRSTKGKKKNQLTWEWACLQTWALQDGHGQTEGAWLGAGRSGQVAHQEAGQELSPGGRLRRGGGAQGHRLGAHWDTVWQSLIDTLNYFLDCFVHLQKILWKTTQDLNKDLELLRKCVNIIRLHHVLVSTSEVYMTIIFIVN